jgi:hypothetical protein
MAYCHEKTLAADAKDGIAKNVLMQHEAQFKFYNI